MTFHGIYDGAPQPSFWFVARLVPFTNTQSDMDPPHDFYRDPEGPSTQITKKKGTFPKQLLRFLVWKPYTSYLDALDPEGEPQTNCRRRGN